MKPNKPSVSPLLIALCAFCSLLVFVLKSKVNKKLMSIPKKSLSTQHRADIRRKDKSKTKEHEWDLNKQ